MEIPVFSGAANLFSSGRAFNLSSPGGEGFENGVEDGERVLGGADHHAIAAIEPPHTAAGADINVVDALCFQRIGTPYVVFEHGIPTIDNDIAFSEQRAQLCHHTFGDLAGGEHDPYGFGA